MLIYSLSVQGRTSALNYSSWFPVCFCVDMAGGPPLQGPSSWGGLVVLLSKTRVTWDHHFQSYQTRAEDFLGRKGQLNGEKLLRDLQLSKRVIGCLKWGTPLIYLFY